MSAWIGDRLFEMSCSNPMETHFDPPEELEDVIDALYWDFLGECALENLDMLERL